jgi:hypothetical protein
MWRRSWRGEGVCADNEYAMTAAHGFDVYLLGMKAGRYDRGVHTKDIFENNLCSCC